MTVRPVARSVETPSRIRRGTLTLLVSRALRQVAFGCMAIMLPIYWHEEGLSTPIIGFLFTLALLGSSTLTVLLAPYVDRIGRRRLLWFASALWTGTAFFLFSRKPAWLAILVLFGSISPSGKEVGLFLSVEQTVLAQLYAGQSQVNAYAWFNLIGYTSAAIGALVASAIGLAQVGTDGLGIFHTVVIGYVAVGFIQLLLYTSLPIEVEAQRPMPIDQPGGSAPESAASGISGKSNPYKPPHHTRRLVYTLSGLFMMDALGAGFIVQGLLVTWFQVKFGFDLTELGLIFFGTNLLSGLSSLVAARLAKTFGLLNTMVFTHLPSNLLLILVPLMPTPWLAVAVLLVRHLLSQMDVPTRQAYTMAIVEPADRAYMSAWTNGVRHYGTGMAPLFTGVMLALSATGLPFFLAGGLKGAYDLLLYVRFRRIPLEHFHQR